MLKLIRKMDQTMTSLGQTMNSHSESIAKVEAHEEELSPIYWPRQQQYQEEQYHPQFFIKIEAKMLTSKSTTSIEKKKSFKVNWWLILMDTTWWMRAFLIMSKPSPH
jgi:hypothetical protein